MLTDKQCKAAVATTMPIKLFDGNGLHLFVTPKGFKGWRMKYRIGRTEKQLTFGPYPEVSLREARDRRDEARALLRQGIDPGAAKRAQVAPRLTLRQFAERWMALQADAWKPKHARDVKHSLETEVFPKLGSLPIAEISPNQVRELLEAIQARGAVETAHRTRARLSWIFRLAIASGEAQSDPAAAIAAVLKPIIKRKRPAVLKLEPARAVLSAIEAEPGFPETKLASRLLALTAARPGMIRWAELMDFHGLDGDEPIWHVPAAKMKLERAESEQDAFDFIIPLSRQAVATIAAARINAGRRRYLFPSMFRDSRPISENALNAAYRRNGFAGRHCPHGWRATFSTIMNERAIDAGTPGDRAVIDLMLAHQPQGVEAAYNRAAYMKRRRELAQQWADLLMEGLPEPETLLAGRRR